jgi:3alpha(or 20beta)-hydroxysteroid dehydrogenase
MDRSGDRLAGKAALVTGAAGGIGKAIVEIFVSAGGKVVATDIAALPDPADGLATMAHDVTAPEAWRAAVALAEERFGALDILVNCAGIFSPAPIESETAEGFMRTARINQLGVFLGMQAALPALRRAGGGSIINLSSAAGLAGNSGTLSYSASKWAVRGMTKVAAVEFARFGIRVNSIHPAAVRTSMVTARAPSDARLGASTLMQRLAEPEEVARMALFLASDDSSFSTGSEFVCDGGLTAY